MNLDKLFEKKKASTMDTINVIFKGMTGKPIEPCELYPTIKDDEDDEERETRLSVLRINSFLIKFRKLHGQLVLYSMMGLDEKDIQDKKDEIKKLLDDELNCEQAEQGWKDFLRKSLEELTS